MRAVIMAKPAPHVREIVVAVRHPHLVLPMATTPPPAVTLAITQRVPMGARMAPMVVQARASRVCVRIMDLTCRVRLRVVPLRVRTAVRLGPMAVRQDAILRHRRPAVSSAVSAASSTR